MDSNDGGKREPPLPCCCHDVVERSILTAVLGHVVYSHLFSISLHQRQTILHSPVFHWSVSSTHFSWIDIPSLAEADYYVQGLAESTFYPGMQYIIGSWYRKDELAKRSCIFHTSSAIATMISGYLMAAVYHLNGRSGFAGWQWYVMFPQ